ncbi:MAG: S8 family peptidase [Flavobacteriaceae bacterium]|nr:S8 family peptidase [Flavobacteriaceae bacterium]
MKNLTVNHALRCLTLLGLYLFSSCGATAPILSTPIENIDQTPVKFSTLTEEEEKNWSHFDLKKDTIPGISLNLAYEKIVRPKSKTIIVAVIDSGIDITHEDLRENIWVNQGEIPNNGIDDDQNGYIDDINGWNFLGEANNEQLEYVRLLASKNTSHPRYREAEELYNKERKEYTGLKQQYISILEQVNTSEKAVLDYLKKDSFSKEDVCGITTKDPTLRQHLSIIKQSYGFGYESIDDLKKDLEKDLKSFNERLDYNLNIDYDGRSIVNDNPDDLNDKDYGNNNVMPKEGRSHGTHVTGIIAAKRNNGIGINGAADNVKIMAIRNTPNGDEYDKDVALAVYYAVDNGAKVINMSFGKGFSDHSNWVRDAIAYAGKNDVLIVAAAGNDGSNTDEVESYPDDQIGKGPEVSDTFLKVGATTYDYSSGLVAVFSNYGKSSVDVFAPGQQIYSSYPKNKYEFAQGTSMAAPLVAGVAALIFSQYPNLNAAQVKKIIMESGLPIQKRVSLEGGNIVEFNSLSKSGKLVNAYNALIMASKYSK